MKREPLIAIHPIALGKPEAAAALSMSVDSFERYVQSDLRVIRRGRLVLIPVTELEAWAEANAERTLPVNRAMTTHTPAQTPATKHLKCTPLSASPPSGDEGSGVLMRSRFTPEARGAVLQGLSAGLTLGEAAERAGLPVQTVKNWCTQGRCEIGTPHAEFALAVEAAREAAGRAVMNEEEFR